MRKFFALLAASCSPGYIAQQIEAYQAEATVSPTWAQLKAPLRLAILPVSVEGVKAAEAMLEINFLGPEDITPGSVYIDGKNVGSVDWVSNSFRVSVSPGSHEVRVFEFMGDELGRARVWVRRGEVVKLVFSDDGLSVAGREKLGQAPGLSQDFALNFLSQEALRTGRFSLVERAKVDEVLKEQEFSWSGLVDPATAVQLGKLLGAEAVLTSQCALRYDAEMESWLATLSGRIVSVETGEVLYVARARGGGLDPESAFEMAAKNFFKRLREQ